MAWFQIDILSHDDMDVFGMEDLAKLFEKSSMSGNLTGILSLLVGLLFLQGVLHYCCTFEDMKIMCAF